MSNSVNGMPARYLASPPTLNDGDATALLVDENGALVISGTPVPVGQAYTTENVTPTRSLNVSTAVTADVANTLGTLINDLKAAGYLG